MAQGCLPPHFLLQLRGWARPPGVPRAVWAQGYPHHLFDIPSSIQVKIPIKEEEADTFSPTQVTYSSSLQRFSPRTISFRVRVQDTFVQPPGG